MLFGQRNLMLTEVERDAMRTAGQFNAQLMDYVRPHVKAGVTTGQLDRLDQKPRRIACFSSASKSETTPNTYSIGASISSLALNFIVCPFYGFD